MTAPQLGDALGEAMRAELEAPGAGDHVVERDDGFVRSDAGAFYFLDRPNWFPGEAEGLQHASGRVLDIGCGAGRIGVALQNDSLEVTAIDPSPGAVEVCRMRGLNRTFETDLVTFAERDEQFDTLIMMGHNLGLLQSPAHSKAVWPATWAMATSRALEGSRHALVPVALPRGRRPRSGVRFGRLEPDGHVSDRPDYVVVLRRS